MVDVSRLRIGVTLPPHGPEHPVTLQTAAQLAEEIGFDSIWMTDHVVMIEGATSPYPFDAGGVMRWDIDHPMLDALVGLAVAGAVTNTIDLGTCVLIAPMRNPVVLAKQVATLDLLTNGRLTLGVGVGWLAEEFAVLDAPFKDRGRRLDEWIEIMRSCWTGQPDARRYRHYEIPPGVRCYPTPIGDVPILAGGMSKAALRRAGRQADGWMGFQYTEELDPDEIRSCIEVIRNESKKAGLSPTRRLAMQTPGPTGPLAERLAELVSAGISEVVTSANWNNPGAVKASYELLRDSAP